MPQRFNSRIFVSMLSVVAVGCLTNLLVANAIGWFSGIDLGVVSVSSRFVATAEMFADVREGKGRGWHVLEWDIKDRQRAADSQYMADNGNIALSGPGVEPSYLRCDSPESFPKWARFWNPLNWPGDHSSRGRKSHGFAEEVAFGWPVISFETFAETPNQQWQGGALIRLNPRARAHWLLWRPLVPQVLIGSAFWAMAVGGTAWGLRRFAQFLGPRPGHCAKCGYDRAGLPPDATCPECGRTPPPNQMH